MKTNSKHLTPLQKLNAERTELRRQCYQEEQLLSEQWNYIRENSGRLIFSGITGILFPRHRKSSDSSGKEKNDFWQNILNNLPYYLSVTNESLSFIWNIARPFYLKWVMSRKK